VSGRSIAAGGGLALAATLLSGSVAEANTYTVTNTGDATPASPGSLRDAINQANANGGSNTITFMSGLSGSINLASELPTITSPITITGPGAGTLTINGGGSTRPGGGSQILDIGIGLTTSEISGLKLTGGDGTGAGLHGNAGAIYAGSPLTVDRVVVSGNQDDVGGGGITAFQALTINDSTISGNSAPYGGGITVDDAPLSISGSTIADNTATSYVGGGVAAYGGAAFDPVTITGSTISGNAAPNVTTGYGGGIYTKKSTDALQDTIVAGNSAGKADPDIQVQTYTGTPTPTASFSLIGNLTGSGITLDGSDVVPQDPRLGPLQANGGPTPTMAPASNSPVIDRGKAFGLTVDQRGLPRPVDLVGFPNASGGDGSDIGAVELQAAEVLPSVGGISPASGAAGSSVVISGEHLAAASQVRFGSTPVGFTINSDGQITATAPAGAGTVDVRVISPGGESAVVAGDRFTYPTPPVSPKVASISSHGAASASFQGSGILITTGLQVSCPAGGASCVVDVSGQTTVSSKLAAAAKLKTLTIGTAHITIPAGQTKTITFRLTSRAVKILRKARHLRVKLTITARDGSGKPTTLHRTITIREPHRAKKRA
jgi:hypothetical protein